MIGRFPCGLDRHQVLIKRERPDFRLDRLMDPIRRSLFTNGLAGFLLLFSASNSFANTCILLPLKLKPVRHVCRLVMNQANERISSAQLALLKGEVEIITVETDADGRLDFKGVAAGDYVLRPLMPGYKPSPVSQSQL